MTRLGEPSITIPSPRDLRWGYPEFPSWLVDFRPAQWEGAQQAIEYFEQGYSVVIAEAPTGSGKTALAEIVRRSLNTRGLYLCSTKQLQTQIEERFDYAAVLWGRQNYPTRNDPNLYPMLNASYCDKSSDHECELCLGEYEGEMGCSFCCPAVSECPYEVAKYQALSSRLAVVNYSYFLTEANYVGRFGEQEVGGKVKRMPFIVADEADVIEQELMGFVEVNISERRRRQFGIPHPAKKTVESAHIEWATRTRQHLRDILRRMPVKITNIDRLKDRQWVLRTYSQVKKLEVGLGDGGWIYDEGRGDQIIFRPVRVDQEATRSMWRHSDKWLLMSATICAPEIMATDLGLEDGDWASFSLPSSFDPKRRPIYVVPRANMKKAEKATEWPKMAPAVAEILRLYPNERVLIPTVSYELNSYLLGLLQREFDSRLITYGTAAQRLEALKQYRRQPGAVLLAPSMDRGVDLAGEDCRCIIIVKVPYLNMGDRQVTARKYSRGGNEWYVVSAIRRLVQMTGRGMRHADDYVDTFILDSAFTSLYAQYGRWFPRWWKGGIDWTRGGRDALKTRGRAREMAQVGEEK